MDNCRTKEYAMERMPEGRVALDDLPIAMAYVPFQHFRKVYELEKGFMYGTIFPELNKPFLGRRGGRYES